MCDVYVWRCNDPSFTELHYDLFVKEWSSGILCIDVGHHREAGHIFYLKSLVGPAGVSIFPPRNRYFF